MGAPSSLKFTSQVFVSQDLKEKILWIIADKMLT